jgi:FAD/FMN-containing dehydrogenase/Fe-S oxidoreductase
MAIPQLTTDQHVKETTVNFLKSLKKTSDFSGDINTNYGNRILYATDNSVYQIIPDAIIFPKDEADVKTLFTLANTNEFSGITFTSRGGGTSTNGQSINSGILIDYSKHMNTIIELNLAEQWVCVQPGIVLDALNDFLKPHRYYFPICISPSNRATIGGMVNTDASGKGSRRHGKTSQHVLELTGIYPDGQIHTSSAIANKDLLRYKKLPGAVGQAYKQVDKTVRGHQKEINSTFPKLDRFMTGYNLAHVLKEKDQFNLNSIICGSEGSLIALSQIKLRIEKIRPYRTLILINYRSFQQALKQGNQLLATNPEAIETLDHTILRLAEQDVIYQKVKNYIHGNEAGSTLNYLEFTAYSKNELHINVSKAIKLLKSETKNYVSFSIIEDDDDIKYLWKLRSKSVGLLAKLKGKRKPVSGIEDTVVPPHKLADYAKELTALLDSHKLQYGMFGHIDAGCLHVRPAFNLNSRKEVKLYNTLAKEVAELVKKHGGILWGEHGKGLRSQFTELYFGSILFQELKKIKKAIDPSGKMNPGKIIPNTALKDLSSHPLRATFDKKINNTLQKKFSTALQCNGNGACFNYSLNDYICPSYKATGDRIHSPKGRASLLREWLRILSKGKSAARYPLSKLIHSIQKFFRRDDLSIEVSEAMQGCLGCQACKTECPVNVDIATQKAKFLQIYYTRYLRPLSDCLLKSHERICKIQHYFPRLFNSIIQNKISRFLLSYCFKIIDPPVFSTPSLPSWLKTNNIHYLDSKKLDEIDPLNTVIILQDWLSSSYNAPLVMTTIKLIQALGFTVRITPWINNGKPLYARGFLNDFKKTAAKNSALLSQISKHKIPIIGIDPSITLTYRHEYLETLGRKQATVFTLQEWLLNTLKVHSLLIQKFNPSKTPFSLLGHCTERTQTEDLANKWVEIYQLLDLKLTILDTGCCGMAGFYGHEKKHYSISKKLFEMSWKQPCQNENSLVTGYSCQSQIQRFTKKRTQHPIEYLYKRLKHL